MFWRKPKPDVQKPPEAAKESPTVIALPPDFRRVLVNPGRLSNALAACHIIGAPVRFVRVQTKPDRIELSVDVAGQNEPGKALISIYHEEI